MKNLTSATAQQPIIVKLVETRRHGIQSESLTRYAIGCVLHGTKYIYEGDRRQLLTRGDIYYMGIGHHYVEHIPDAAGQPFEEIRYYYTPADLQRILLHLNISYRMKITNNHRCDQCQGHAYVVMRGWKAGRNLFFNTNNYLHDEDFVHDETAENLKMTELIYQIVAHEARGVKRKLNIR